MTTPNLARIMGASLDARLAELEVCRPGRVESYSALTGRATVKPLILKPYRDEEGERQVADLPPITDVPVVFPGSGGARIKFPISVGDTVLLLFSSASLDRWLATGRNEDPVDERMHTLTDAIAIPGLAHLFSDASPQIEFTLTGEIHAGGNRRLAYASDLEDLRQEIAGAASGDAIPAAVNTLGPFTGTSVLRGDG
jgi:hypothetical protein